MNVLIEGEWTRGDMLSALGILVSLAGFVFAGITLFRTMRATEATARAMQSASRRQLHLLLPQFKILELELDYALEHENRSHAARILASCAHLAGDVSGLLSENPDAFDMVSPDVIAQLDEVAAKASRAKSTIYTAQKRKLVSITGEFRESFAVSIQLVGRLQMSNALSPSSPER